MAVVPVEDGTAVGGDVPHLGRGEDGFGAAWEAETQAGDDGVPWVSGAPGGRPGWVPARAHDALPDLRRVMTVVPFAHTGVRGRRYGESPNAR
ncbi:hypothetical protein GCM10022420_029620 [Streptomyces iranensis]